MKKLAIIFGAIFAVLLGLILVIPLVVNVDKYRPQIVEAANQEINGTLELGKLSLSLWGQIRVEVGGVVLKDKQGSVVVSVKDSYFHIPFSSLLSGSPTLTFKMSHPLVSVLKNKAGKMNVLTLKKEKASASAAATGTPPPATPAAATATAPAQALPAMLTRARLGIELNHANLTYVDQATGLNSEVKDLNLVIRDISLSRPMGLEMWADLDTRMGKTFALKGEARLTGKAEPHLKDGKFVDLSLTLQLNLDAVEMSVPGTFEKKKGVPTNAMMSLTASEQSVRIDAMKMQFHNLTVSGNGNVVLPPSDNPAGEPSINVSLKSNEMEFAPWVELVPMLKDFSLGGKARFEATANGKGSKLGYTASLNFAGLTAKAPKLKTQPRFDGMIHVITDQVDQIQVTMKAPGNDLRITGKVVSFSKPNVTFNVASSGMDLDQLVEFPPPAAKGKAAAPAAAAKDAASGSSAESGSSAKGSAPGADYDALLAPLRENAMLAGIEARLGIEIKLLKAYEVKVSDIVCKMNFKDLAFGMDPCGFKVFAGTIKSTMGLQLKPKTPTYQFSTQVAGLELIQAVESQMALFKNTVTGRANFSMTAQGSSFNPVPATANLNAKGTFKVENATFATIDVMKMVSEGLTKSIDKIADKVPAAKGKTLPALPSTASKYEFISSDFTISGGKFSSPNFEAKAKPNEGIDIKGRTTVGLKDDSLDTAWEVIDTYNMTHARDLSVEQAGVKVEHVLAEGSSPVKFPLHAGCTIKAPCYSYTEVPEYLGKVALNNVAHAAGERAKQEAKKAAESAIQRMAPPAIQNQLKKFF